MLGNAYPAGTDNTRLTGFAVKSKGALSKGAARTPTDSCCGSTNAPRGAKPASMLQTAKSPLHAALQHVHL